jgi:hypothetical protein
MGPPAASKDFLAADPWDWQDKDRIINGFTLLKGNADPEDFENK